MTVSQIQQEILRLKERENLLILAHSYVGREIAEVADFTGDSYALALKAAAATEDKVLLCGVRFMAETVKMLCPQKKVYLSHPQAGCPMAEEMSIETLKELKARYPGAATVAYINTTAELKALADVCVTSSSAERIVRALPQKEILFLPDINLGSYLKSRLPDKVFHFFNGGCPVHTRATEADVLAAKALHPNALFLVHPECKGEVVSHADYVGSTSGIIDYAKKSSAREFIIGTENAVLETLEYECPEKKFYPLHKEFLCADMKLTTLAGVLACCRGEGEEIVLDEGIRLAAKRSIDAMISLGG